MLFDKELIIFLASTRAMEARAFYKDTLGLMLLREEESLLEFRANGILLRINIVKELKPQPFTVLGWKVNDISEIIRGLNNKNISCERFEALRQDKQGIWTSPSGVKVAWFKDPDGNILSLTE